ncbi:helix-turn-helix transcriptional regulator [Halomonas urumqiensis]|uniref:HTH luxR-type domain-containing protein n=1 Tax=Halomonas urumqiensis TaxID=1684789 RepID=A0A2N7UKJ3_9GAMM|nr:helix-turn-helix transcriptional regulator [Halomonas urumqiensis]PMR80919.1 hypothetical protein C1H70_07655 [Halomonas urumqiensis]PTB02877.1 hypothetical protein C6V82_09655 [Halomonas urumqiensis]GHE21399.1 hypothetical protein GCM10017767_19200 [Halomonas urumqiensis]
MFDEERTTSALLNTLYDNVTQPDGWPTFLQQLATRFDSPTAVLRITDRADPVVYQSFTVGITQGLDYGQEAVTLDPFRVPLATGPLGKVHVSQDIISDRAFERSDHYQVFFRPNGNFYAMGAQFERDGHAAMHVGIHRPYDRGAFTERERLLLQGFNQHFRRVVQLTRLTHQVQASLMQARHALDALPFGVLMLDAEFRCQWLNRAAEEALATHCFGLRQRNGHLTLEDGKHAAGLTQAVRTLRKGESHCECIRLSAHGASLVLMRNREGGWHDSLSASRNAGVIAFLLDPQLATPLDHARLRSLYGLTVAELRLVDLLIRGLDVTEASACLQVSAHTTRTHLKSIMQKTDVSRQAELIRKLLLSVGMINRHE